MKTPKKYSIYPAKVSPAYGPDMILFIMLLVKRLLSGFLGRCGKAYMEYFACRDPFEKLKLELAGTINKGCRVDKNMRNCIIYARHTFTYCYPSTAATPLVPEKNIRIVYTNVKAVLLYGSETWRKTQKTTQLLYAFINNLS